MKLSKAFLFLLLLPIFLLGSIPNYTKATQHQQEIAWIQSHAADFAKADHLSIQQAQALLSLGALGMVDAEDNAKIQRLIHAGVLTQKQIQKAQAYIKGHVVHEKATFDNEHHYDDTYDFKQPMFTVDAEQYFDHNYNPNRMLEGITPNTLDVVAFIPPLRGLGAAAKGVGKGAKNAFRDYDPHTMRPGHIGWGKTPNYVIENRLPKDKETFLNNSKYTKTSIKVKGAQVYKDNKGYYYHRDTLHKGEGAEIEVYNKRGEHIGTADPLTGIIDKSKAKKGRTINVK